MKKQIYPVFICLCSLLLAGCNNSGGGNSLPDDKDPNYYSENGDWRVFDTASDLNINESFAGGLNDSVWYTLEGSWHTEDTTAPHNGMKNRNLFYVHDGDEDYLAIRGRGIYNKDSDFEYNKPEGGCIITQKHLGPGRYEIEMAAMPRRGGVSTMWTYCTTTGSEATSQNEIDIELGGTTKGTQFEHEWCTTWTTHTTKATDTVDVTDIAYLNDGQIHKFTFDWYTNYAGTGEKRVDWFLDGILIDTLTGNIVPDHSTPLWIGLWFPPLWAGMPTFEEDYMLVRNISFTAFTAEQYYDDCRSQPGYNKKLPSASNIQTIEMSKIKNVNKLSNTDFESLDIAPRDESYYGWLLEDVSKGNVELSNESTKGSRSFKINAGEDGGTYLDQELSNAYTGYKYHLSIDAKLSDSTSKGNIEIYMKSKTGKDLSTKLLNVTSTSFTTLEYDITMPEDASSLLVCLTAEKGSVLYDNASLTYLGL